jgi:carbon-monoxide dehydrogenase large subunit
VRSTAAHAVLSAVDTAAARRAPGVAAVLAGRDLGGVVEPLAPRLDALGFTPTIWHVLCDSRVRFVGEPIAIVVADTAYAAADAGELVRANYELLPVVATIDAALAENAYRLHADHDRNVLFERRHRHGDVERAFAAASVVVRETFRHARLSASPLEPRGVIARWDGDAVTVWTGTQVPHIVRAALAHAFGLAERKVRVIVPDTGGGFGQKMHVMPEDLAVAAAARLINRPVKWTETRRENLASASQAREARVEIEAAADARGGLLGLRARIWSDAGSQHIYPLTASLEPMGTATILPGPYRTPAYAYDVLSVATNKPPLGAYRGVGMTMGVFVMERALDLCADRLGLDPAEIRRRNLISRDDYPFPSAAGFVYDSGDYPTALALALDLAGYERLVRERDAARRDGRLLGVGIACYTEYTGMGGATYRGRGMVHVPGHEAATVSIGPDGSVDVHVSFPSQGQGHATTAAQIAADRLGVPIESVRVIQPDTETAPAGTGTFASRSAIAQGGAVDGAAKTVRAELIAIAAAALEASPADLELTGGRVSVRGVPGRDLSVADLARIGHSAQPGAGRDARTLEATEVFDPPGPTFSGAVHVASVEVDPDTGRVTVRAYALVEDCGPVINPLIVEGQIHGAVAQGIGEALDERLVYDEQGQLLTGTLMDYALPVASALPAFALGHLETASPLTPGGYKGMGEGGTIGAPAAIANAVADAVRPLGIAVTALPILPEALRRPRTLRNT